MSLTGRLQARMSAPGMGVGVPCPISHLSIGRKKLEKGPVYARRRHFRGSLALGLPDDVALFSGASVAAASISYIAARALEFSSGVDSATLPLEYDPLRIEAYWRRRPLQARQLLLVSDATVEKTVELWPHFFYSGGCTKHDDYLARRTTAFSSILTQTPAAKTPGSFFD